MVEQTVTCPKCHCVIAGKPEREFTATGDKYGRFNTPRKVFVYLCNGCHQRVQFYKNPPIETLADILVKKYPHLTKEQVAACVDNPSSLLKSSNCPACGTATSFNPHDLYVCCRECGARLRHVVVRQKGK